MLSHYNLYRMAEFVGDAKAGYSSGQPIKALQETAERYFQRDMDMNFQDLAVKS